MQALTRAILTRYPRTLAEQAGLDVERNTPSPLFRLLCFCLLSGRPMPHQAALAAALALVRRGWGTPARLAASQAGRRTAALRSAGYARFAEGAGRDLGELATQVLDEYGGDLRKLRARAGGDPGGERRLLMEFRGIGAVSADIFFREAQLAWDELLPFADPRALAAAARIGLPADPRRLAALVRERRTFVRLVDGLVRIQLEDAFAEVRAAA